MTMGNAHMFLGCFGLAGGIPVIALSVASGVQGCRALHGMVAIFCWDTPIHIGMFAKKCWDVGIPSFWGSINHPVLVSLFGATSQLKKSSKKKCSSLQALKFGGKSYGRSTSSFEPLVTMWQASDSGVSLSHTNEIHSGTFQPVAAKP